MSWSTLLVISLDYFDSLLYTLNKFIENKMLTVVIFSFILFTKIRRTSFNYSLGNATRGSSQNH